MDLCFLGTASCTPTSSRLVSGTALRREGVTWLFDCGEGIQINLQESVVRPVTVSRVFITHTHGDHCFGLPGMMCLLSAANPEGKGPPIEIVGPKGLRKLVRANALLSFSRLAPYVVHELCGVEFLHGDLGEFPEPTLPDIEIERDPSFGEQEGGRDIFPDEEGVYHIFEAGDDNRDFATVRAAAIQHTVPCVGYVIDEKPSPGKLDASAVKPLLLRNTEALKAQGHKNPMSLLSTIKSLPLSGQLALPDGTVIRRSEVVGKQQPGRRVVILGDTCDSSRVMKACCQPEGVACDVLVHEATNAFLEGDTGSYEAVEANTRRNGHSTPEMAGRFAAAVAAKHLVLTHFSQRYKGGEQEESVQVMNQIRDCAVKAWSDQVGTTVDKKRVTCARDLMVIPVPKPQ